MGCHPERSRRVRKREGVSGEINKMKIKYILIGTLVLLAGYGTAYLVRQGQLLSDTLIEYAGYKVDQLSLTHARVRVTLRLTNKSNWDVTILSQTYDARLNGFPVGKINSIKPLILYKGKSGTTDLVIDFNPQEAIKTGLTQLIANFGNAQLTIDGSFAAQTAFIVVNRIPVTETWTMKNFKVQSSFVEANDTHGLKYQMKKAA